MSFGITSPPAVSVGGQFAAAKIDLPTGTHTQGVSSARNQLVVFENVAIAGFGGLFGEITPEHKIGLTDLAPSDTVNGDLFRYDLNLSLKSPRNMLITYFLIFRDSNGTITIDQTNDEPPNNANFYNVSLNGLFTGPTSYGTNPRFLLEYLCAGSNGNLHFRQSSMTIARV